MARYSFVIALLALLWGGGAATQPPAGVGPVPDELREALELDPFYQKHFAVESFAILGSKRVSDAAMLEAAWILGKMLGDRPEILRTLATRRARLVVMAHDEFTTDLPEQTNMTPRVFWDRRARGLGGRVASCAEENLLCFPGDPYSTENILIHEFAHVVHGVALRALDSTFDTRLREAYLKAQEAGRWANTYAITSRGEYWAEGVQSWFDDNRENDSLHNHVNTRAELREYDPALARLCEEVFGDGPWRYQKPMRRPAAERVHLASHDPAKAPRFRWREAPVPERPRVSIQTAMGSIEVELDTVRAPITVTNFLRYVHDGLYSDGEFHRTLTLENQPATAVKIEVAQASANPARTNEYPAPIVLERTRDTQLKHVDGAISMARKGPDTAQDDFFICIGDQPELDFGGRRNPDGQGFAVFGRVTKGMDVVRKIQQSQAEGEKLTPPVRIQRAVRLN
jgi:cyclophilin family peptidyl-prolyl cis-trans isomerase